MRLTRAQAQAAAQAETEAARLHVDDDAAHATKTPDKNDRSPLGELARNTIDVDTGAVVNAAQPAAKGRKKASKSNSAGGEKHVDATLSQNQGNAVLHQDRGKAVQPQDQGKTALPQDHCNAAQPQDHENAAQPQNHNVHDGHEATQAVQTETDGSDFKGYHAFNVPQSSPQVLRSENDQRTALVESRHILQVQVATTDPFTASSQDEQVMSPLGEPADIIFPPHRTLAKSLQAKEAFHARSTSNKENEQPLSSTASAPVSAPTQSMPSPATDVPVEHGDQQLDENTAPGATLPSGNGSMPRAAEPVDSSEMPARGLASSVANAQGSTSSSSSTIRNPSSKKPLLKSTTAPRRHTIKPSDAPNPENKTAKAPANIPHSKPRPMSMSFPPPPAPPKSTRAPTKPSFQLPGEAVAAKLKAAREARLNKDGVAEESEKRPAFKARPAPKVKDGPPPIVRETASSRARESLMLGKVPSQSTSASALGGTKRAASVRESIIKARPLADRSKRVSNAPVRDLSVASGKSSTSSKPVVHNRPSSALIDRSQPRASLAQRNTSSAPNKGKEVFQRAAVEQDALEKQKRDKEEAARKARAEAAERGRIASREWAEKMRLKALKAKGALHDTDGKPINAAAV